MNPSVVTRVGARIVSDPHICGEALNAGLGLLSTIGGAALTVVSSPIVLGVAGAVAVGIVTKKIIDSQTPERERH